MQHMYSWWWVELSPERCRVKPLRRINAIFASYWIYFTINLYCLQRPWAPLAQTPSVEAHFAHPLAPALAFHYKKNYLGFFWKMATRILPCNWNELAVCSHRKCNLFCRENTVYLHDLHVFLWHKHLMLRIINFALCSQVLFKYVINFMILVALLTFS